MAITWTIILLGVLLPVMASDPPETTTQNVSTPTQPTSTEQPTSLTKTTLAPATITTQSILALTTSAPTQPNLNNPTTQPSSTQPTVQPKTSNPVTTTEPITQPTTAPYHTSDQFNPNVENNQLTTTLQASPSETTQKPSENTPTTTNSKSPIAQTSTPYSTLLSNLDQVSQHSSADPSTQSGLPDQTTPAQPGSTDPKLSNQTTSEKTTKSPEPESTTSVSQNLQTAQTDIATNTSVLLPERTGKDTGTSIPPPKIFNHTYDLSSTSSKGNVVHDACKTLAQNMKGNCSATVEIRGKQLIINATIDADQMIPLDIYKQREQKTPDDDGKGTIPDTLIAILASCGALVLILCFFAAYCTYHRRSYRKNQQHLTEELQTVENGYHDNPTLEVMEVQPEMQEKKVALNGEFNDSWIVPIDNLLKEDIPDEEDTHL